MIVTWKTREKIDRKREPFEVGNISRRSCGFASALLALYFLKGCLLFRQSVANHMMNFSNWFHSIAISLKPKKHVFKSYPTITTSIFPQSCLCVFRYWNISGGSAIRPTLSWVHILLLNWLFVKGGLCGSNFTSLSHGVHLHTNGLFVLIGFLVQLLGKGLCWVIVKGRFSWEMHSCSCSKVGNKQ